ncbi:hypothetical protein [Roseomonas xinghualingensis]|uniref:hypothetical protein n=1 Tax=Roseomonas xinghualingensis TaxID=2986475 RepID=UPI0021F0BF12|nr:hypothetical protein [Roseomonas sp. SXEYE001]MCV4209815.1 hypothetical protein [Roseomonas sp. SXEYE001]
MGIEDDVVRTVQGLAITFGVEDLGPARRDVDTLDTTASVVLRDADRAQVAVGLFEPAEAAVVRRQGS